VFGITRSSEEGTNGDAGVTGAIGSPGPAGQGPRGEVGPVSSTIDVFDLQSPPLQPNSGGLTRPKRGGRLIYCWFSWTRW